MWQGVLCNITVTGVSEWGRAETHGQDCEEDDKPLAVEEATLLLNGLLII